ncbi:MAG: glutamine cyclotransferase [Flaviaesturariibacter sp.]|nr:glutamine cyclotransferase [Flaviaesturariibacter sp.]
MFYFWPMKFLAGLFLLCAICVSCGNDDTSADPGTDTSTGTPATAPSIAHQVTAAYPHDTSSFTEGLLFYNGQLLESGGNYGRSKIFLYDLKTGRQSHTTPVDAKFFGEGTCVFRDTIYQMTWKEKTVLVYDKNLRKIKELPLPIDGWGLTTDGASFIASDGSSNLNFFDPSTFRLLRTQGVTENGMPISNINELEYVDGVLYANQWQTNYILRIDPASGRVTGRLDLSDLDQRAHAKNPQADVLNGIAYDPSTKKLYVTGKNWPEIYELQVSPAPAQ